MYRRILLATDDSAEGLIALREGALMARALDAQVRLLVIEAGPLSAWPGEEMLPGPDAPRATMLLDRGLSRLRQLGLDATGRIAAGEPTLVIAAEVKQLEADLIVVGYRRRSLVARWWLGEGARHLADHVSCSVLVARTAVSDEMLTEATQCAGVQGIGRGRFDASSTAR
jgi:nucleotide-binding universal stress UspA family protein